MSVLFTHSEIGLKVLIPASSLMIVALALTPEMTTAVSVLVSALFFGVWNLYTARTARLVVMRETRAAIAPIADKLEQLAPVIQKIDHHVNSEKDRAQSELVQKDLQIRLQQELIEHLKHTAGLVAQAKVTTDIISQAAGKVTEP